MSDITTDPVDADASPADTSVPSTPVSTGRAAPSNLEGDLKVVLDGVVTGSIALPDGKLATPHILAGLIATARGTDARPSSGAVAAALTRWSEIGFIELNEAPVSFRDYTDAGREKGLNALKAEHRDRLKAARAASKAAAAPAEPETVPESVAEAESYVETVPAVDTSAPF